MGSSRATCRGKTLLGSMWTDETTGRTRGGAVEKVIRRELEESQRTEDLAKCGEA